jgi:hypothetical protein
VTLIVISTCQPILEDSLLVKSQTESCTDADPECYKKVSSDVCLDMDCDDIADMINT